MDDRNNTIFGWALGAAIVALGGTIASGMYFNGHRPHEMGFPVEAGEGGGGDKGPAIETLLQTADAAKGETLFAKCSTCHTINAGGANGIGPNLYGTMGKPLAGHAGFAYSDALKSKGGTWTWQAMNEWLSSPRKYANGTKMSFAGLSKAEDRANLMVYLNAQGSNIALPAAPAADAPADAGTTDAGKGGSAAPGDAAAAGDAKADPAKAAVAAEASPAAAAAATPAADTPKP